MTIDSVFQSRLRERQLGVNPEWRIWEQKTLNIHCGILPLKGIIDGE